MNADPQGPRDPLQDRQARLPQAAEDVPELLPIHARFFGRLPEGAPAEELMKRVRHEVPCSSLGCRLHAPFARLRCKHCEPGFGEVNACSALRRLWWRFNRYIPFARLRLSCYNGLYQLCGVGRNQ